MLRSRFLLSCFSLSLAVTACATAELASDGDALFERGDFHGARVSYEEASALAPDDAALKEKWKTARVFEMLDTGRKLLFAGHDFQALERFEEALRADPENQTAKMWIDKARQKITKEKIKTGFESLAEEDYAEATESFQQALLIQPRNEDALAGLVRIREILDKKLGRSEDYALRGIRDQAANLLYQADANYGKAHLYNPADPDVQARGRDVKHQLAERKFLEAQGFEKERNFGAALVGYRAVRSIEPEYPEIAEHIGAVELELKAEEQLRRGKMLLIRGEFEAARKVLVEARKLRVGEKTLGELQKKIDEIDQRELAALYLEARTLEQGARYEEAAAKYDLVLKKAPYYEDTIARLDLVRGVVAKAGEIYAAGTQAEEAGEREKARKLYEEIFSFYPRFKDVAERIEKLRSE